MRRLGVLVGRHPWTRRFACWGLAAGVTADLVVLALR